MEPDALCALSTTPPESNAVNEDRCWCEFNKSPWPPLKCFREVNVPVRACACLCVPVRAHVSAPVRVISVCAVPRACPPLLV